MQYGLREMPVHLIAKFEGNQKLHTKQVKSSQVSMRVGVDEISKYDATVLGKIQIVFHYSCGKSEHFCTCTILVGDSHRQISPSQHKNCSILNYLGVHTQLITIHTVT